MIHSVSLPIAVACNSCLFENSIVAHFTELNFFKQATTFSPVVCLFPQRFPDQGHIWPQWYVAI